MLPIKIGVIGTGNMGRNHVRLLSELPEFDLVGIFDPNPDSAKAMSVYDAMVFDSVASLVGKVDAVVISNPSSKHLETALYVADQGIHALVEKPLGLDVKEATTIHQAFEKTGKILMVGHVERFNPVTTEIEKIIKNEDVIAINVERFSPKNPRISDADVLQDLMIHDLDIVINALVPSKISHISAVGSTVYSDNNADYAQALLAFENGVLASIAASRTTEEKVRSINIHTKTSFIQIDLLNKTINITHSTNYKLSTTYQPTYRQESVMERVFIPIVEPLRAELIHFANCINSNTTPITSGKNAVYALDILGKISEKIYS